LDGLPAPQGPLERHIGADCAVHDARGTPSGDELAQVAANVVDDLADRLRASDEEP
jgi:hypothetical protein